jgi:hypothetical protein
MWGAVGLETGRMSGVVETGRISVVLAPRETVPTAVAQRAVGLAEQAGRGAMARSATCSPVEWPAAMPRVAAQALAAALTREAEASEEAPLTREADSAEAVLAQEGEASEEVADGAPTSG